MERKSALGKHRFELMGIGALGVLLVHSLGFVPWPGPVRYVVNYGGLGVYFFLFLSGVGLYHSLISRGTDYSKRDFYKRRIARVLIPYLLIAGIWYGIKYLLIEGKPAMFLYEWLTLSFWAEHTGAWFVAALIPIYLGYPFFFDWIEKGRRGLKTSFCLGCILLVMAVLYRVRPSLYSHLSQVLNGLWVFVLGNYCGKEIRAGSNLPHILLWFAGAFLVEKLLPVNSFLPTDSIMYAFKGVLMLVVAGYALDLIKCRYVHSILAWLGKRSLELYLTNIFLIQAVRYFGWDTWAGVWKGYILYGLIAMLGVLSSEGFAALENKIRRPVPANA